MQLRDTTHQTSGRESQGSLHWRHGDHDGVSNHQPVYSIVYSDADQRKHQSSASLAFVRGIHRDQWIPRTRASNAENVSIWWRHHVTAATAGQPRSLTLDGPYHVTIHFYYCMWIQLQTVLRSICLLRPINPHDQLFHVRCKLEFHLASLSEKWERWWINMAWRANLKNTIKGLRPVLEGFVVTMHEGACETGSQIPRALARGIWRTVRTSPSALWQQTRQIGLNHDYNMTFSISPREC